MQAAGCRLQGGKTMSSSSSSILSCSNNTNVRIRPEIGRAERALDARWR
jgi:hypothetical protein